MNATAVIDENGVVVEVLRPVPGFTLEQCFHIDLLNKTVPCPESVTPGMVWIGGEEFSEPSSDKQH